MREVSTKHMRFVECKTYKNLDTIDCENDEGNKVVHTTETLKEHHPLSYILLNIVDIVVLLKTVIKRNNKTT